MEVIIEIILQTVLAFFATLFFARIIGKKQISELTFYDYINGITFGSIAGNMASDIDQRTWQHLIGLSLFAFLTFLLQYISLKSRIARKVIEGEPTILIHKGKILEENMKQTRFNMSDLMSELRQNQIFDIRDVHYAILETDGYLSVLPVANKQPATPEDLGLQPEEDSICSELVIDGQIIKDNLKQHGLTEDWLQEKLREQKIVKLEEVILVIYNPVDKSLYFDFKDDNLSKDKVDISDF
ncbi:DUF421 domain-containing protein [Halanaerocella petrolearia]